MRRINKKINIEVEPFWPNDETLDLVENVAKEIKPNNPKIFDWYKTYTSGHVKRIAFDLDIVRDNCNTNAKLLEIGSIPLLLTAALYKSGYKTIGLDIEPERFSTSINNFGFEVLKCDVETEILPFENNHFDAVIFNELFEHLRINPIFTFSELHRILKPDGIVFISTPNLKSIYGLINYLFNDSAHSCTGDIYIEYQKLEALGHMGHVREYTKTEVLKFLENTGFGVKKMIYRGKFKSKKSKLVMQLIPSLRPFISYVAFKLPKD